MKIFLMPRQSGKTTFLLAWLARKPQERTLVVHAEVWAERLRLTYCYHDKPYKQIVSLSYLKSNKELFSDRTIAIDDLDLVPNQLLPGINIDLVMHTQPD